MQLLTILRLFGLARLALGLWLATAPNKAGEIWFGSADQPASTIALMRGLGGRDVGLGLGLALNPQLAPSLLPIGIVADIVDAIAALLIHDRIPRKSFRAATTGAFVYAGVGTAIRLRARDASGVSRK